MTLVYRAVKKDDADYQKYVALEQRYMEETPNELLKKHNYLYSSVGSSYYKKAFSICVGDATVISDDERKIDFLLMHFENIDPDYYSTPMAWVLFFDHYIILVNCERDNDVGSLDNGNKWYKNIYLVEPLVLSELIQNREEEIKQYIIEALTAYSESGYAGGRLPIFTKRDTEVIFDQPYQFPGYCN